MTATTYDGADRPLTVSGTLNGLTTPYVNSISYWPHGAPEGIFYGNNVVPVYVYNSRLQLNQIYATVGNSANNYLWVENFNWGSTNNNGNLLAKLEAYGASVPASSLASFSQSFAYDNLNRLTAASDTGGWSQSFGYDAFGNMWESTAGLPLVNSRPTANVYNANNRMTTASYDAVGNQTTIPNVPGAAQSYNAENRIVQVTGSGTTTYAYDVEGRRVEKTTASGTTVYVYDAMGKLVAEYSPVNTPSPCTTCYLTWDQLGSTRLVTDKKGAVIARHDFTPFGEEIPVSVAGRSSAFGWGSADNVNQKFTGKERDQESGLDYFGARYYGSALGRFTSPDPIGIMKQKLLDPQQWNAYGYARNNPLRFMDPTGKYVISCGSGVKDCNKQTEAFNNAVMNGLHSKDQSVVSAAKAYGTLGEKNGVNVSIVTVVDPNNKGVTGSVGAMAGTGGTQSTADGRFMQATQVKIQAGLSADQLSDTTVHEGQHVGDRENFVNALQADQSGALVQGLNITHKMSEVNAYGVENANRGERGQDPRDINDILSHRPYSTDPNINRPLFPDFPSPYAPN